ncbi:hypothetical protein FEM08_23950 [Flavobacterium gilvum]|nr:hypothetical protein FEM08_23950 [Flavobacterium gilvum]
MFDQFLKKPYFTKQSKDNPSKSNNEEIKYITQLIKIL